MRLSIRARMILAMNALVAAVGLAVGYAGIEVAAHQVERKLVHEAAQNAADLIGRKSWPLDSDALMGQVAQILGAEAASAPPEGGRIVSSSLPEAQRAELAAQLSAHPPGRPPPRVTLAGRPYRLGAAAVRRLSASLAEQQRRFYLLVPEETVLAAQRGLAGRIALCTLVAVVIATVVGFWLSTTIARPIRRLADRMDHVAARGAEALSDAGPSAGGRGEKAPAGAAAPAVWRAAGLGKAAGPTELARLTRSFDELLSRLAAARRQLDRSARLAALGQLAASVAHELRNPLSGIKMNARVLADELAATGSADKSLELIIREIDRMDLYLQELLSLAATGGTTRAEAATEPLRLEELAESVAALLAGRCEHAGVAMVRDYPAQAPPARGVPTRIRQVLLNLMLNALDAMPHGGRMTLACREGRDGTVRLEVSDTGGGVRAPEGADIFEPFVSTKPAGSGLGLYVCRQAVEAMGGRIGYASSPSGSTFWIELPAAGAP